MAETQIDSNPFPMGPLSPTPGTPLSLMANYPEFDPHVNLILVESDTDNLGRVFFGNTRLNVVTREGLIKTLNAPGDVVVISNFAQNVYDLSTFRVDVEVSGDKVNVSVYVR